MTEERKFGLVVGGAFALAGLALVLASKDLAAAVAGGLAAALFLTAAAAPRALAPVRRGWTAFAHALGRVNTVVFLSVVFFLVLTPLGVLLRIAGRDELARRRKGRSTWVPYPERNRDPRHFEKMF